MAKLIIQVGKSYLSRAGGFITITSKLDEHTSLYKQGYRFVGGPCGQYYTEDGLTYVNDPGDNPGDLMEEINLSSYTAFEQAKRAMDESFGRGKDQAHRLIQIDPTVNRIYQCAIHALQKEILKRQNEFLR